MSEVIPAILPRNTDDLREKVAKLPPEATLFHFDVLEEDIWALDLNRNFEVHLMVESPEDIIEKWINRGSRRIITHKFDIDFINKYKDQVELGLGIELQASINQLLYLIPKVSFVHLMSIAQIGEQGHPFDPRVFDRIVELRKEFPDLFISVDGGIDKNNYQYLVDVGVNRLVVGSHFEEVWNLQTKK